MITKDDISKKDMIDAINELESIHRVYEAKNEDNWSEEDYKKVSVMGKVKYYTI